jgi:hypothetical protein
MARIKTKGVGGAATPAEVLQLISPIVEFLRRSGASETELEQAFSTSLARVRRLSQRFEVKRMGDYYSLSYITHHWRSHPDYANLAGKPIQLSLIGKKSVSALVQLAGIKERPSDVLRLMIRLGNVKKARNGKYALLKRYTNYKTPAVLPFEPNHQFLSDAIAAATRGMGGVGSSSSLYWINDHLKRIPAKHVSPFLNFLRVRSTAYVEEIGEWLQQVALPDDGGPRPRKQTYRLGVGVFPICTKD